MGGYKQIVLSVARNLDLSAISTRITVSPIRRSTWLSSSSQSTDRSILQCLVYKRTWDRNWGHGHYRRFSPRTGLHCIGSFCIISTRCHHCIHTGMVHIFDWRQKFAKYVFSIFLHRWRTNKAGFRLAGLMKLSARTITTKRVDGAAYRLVGGLLMGLLVLFSYFGLVARMEGLLLLL